MQAFRTRKETIKATYTAAEAQTRINEAFSGISEEIGDVGLAIQRAEDKTAQMQARAGAIDELLASGALEDHVSGPRTPSRRNSTSSAPAPGRAELARMKGEISASAPKQLEAATARRRPVSGGRRRREQPQAGDGRDRADPRRGPVPG